MSWADLFAKIGRKLARPRAEVLGVLLHGRFDQLVVRQSAYVRIGQAMESDDRFETEMAYTKWQRAEQKILYGRTLTREQKVLIGQLTGRLQVPDADIVKLMYARAVTREGQFWFKERVQAILACLALMNAGLALLWIVLASLDLVVNSGASWPSISAAVLIILVIPGLPTIYMAYCGITPLMAFRRLSDKMRNAGQPLRPSNSKRSNRS